MFSLDYFILLHAGRWFSPGTPVSSTNKTDHRDITEILLKVALNTIALTLYYYTKTKIKGYTGYSIIWPQQADKVFFQHQFGYIV